MNPDGSLTAAYGGGIGKYINGKRVEDFSQLAAGRYYDYDLFVIISPFSTSEYRIFLKFVTVFFSFLIRYCFTNIWTRYKMIFRLIIFINLIKRRKFICL